MSLISPLDYLFLPVTLLSKSVLEQIVNVVMNPFFFPCTQILCALWAIIVTLRGRRPGLGQFGVSSLCLFILVAIKSLLSTHLDAG